MVNIGRVSPEYSQEQTSCVPETGSSASFWVAAYLIANFFQMRQEVSDSFSRLPYSVTLESPQIIAGQITVWE